MQNRASFFARTRLAVLISGLFLAASGSAVAGSACKGLSQSKCSNNDDCSWVSSYKTKKGVKVDAYCRAKSGKSAGAGETKKSDKGKKAEKPSKTKKEEKTAKSDKSSSS